MFQPSGIPKPALQQPSLTATKLRTKPPLPRVGELSGSLEQLLLLSAGQQPAVRGARRGRAAPELGDEQPRRPHLCCSLEVLLWWAGAAPGHSSVPAASTAVRALAVPPGCAWRLSARSPQIFSGGFVLLLSRFTPAVVVHGVCGRQKPLCHWRGGLPGPALFLLVP